MYLDLQSAQNNGSISPNRQYRRFGLFGAKTLTSPTLMQNARPIAGLAGKSVEGAWILEWSSSCHVVKVNQ